MSKLVDQREDSIKNIEEILAEAFPDWQPEKIQIFAAGLIERVEILALVEPSEQRRQFLDALRKDLVTRMRSDFPKMPHLQ